LWTLRVLALNHVSITVIIALKFCHELKKIGRKGKNQGLAIAAGKYLPKDTIGKSFSVAIQNKLAFFVNFHSYPINGLLIYLRL
jgi:hypothetical protein